MDLHAMYNHLIDQIEAAIGAWLQNSDHRIMLVSVVVLFVLVVWVMGVYRTDRRY